MITTPLIPALAVQRDKRLAVARKEQHYLNRSLFFFSNKNKLRFNIYAHPSHQDSLKLTMSADHLLQGIGHQTGRMADFRQSHFVPNRIQLRRPDPGRPHMQVHRQ
jgi:hypothetical protein